MLQPSVLAPDLPLLLAAVSKMPGGTNSGRRSGPGLASIIRDGEPESAAVDRRIGSWTVLVSSVPLGF
jgi:hypothetical protein